MRHNTVVLALAALIASAALCAQKQSAGAAPETSHDVPAARAPYFIDPKILDLALIVPPPPAQGSAITKTELDDLHRMELTRTPAQVAAAQIDDKEQDIFIFTDVMGQKFTAQELPLTATLSSHVHKDEGVATASLKSSFHRPRPYQFDHSLHPVCDLTKEPNSYPSGHTVSGYLLALTLIEIVPEKRQQILERAEDYSHNRMICGVHYPSDIEASRKIAYLVFGYMLANPRFQNELALARGEARQHLGLPMAMPLPQELAGSE